MSFWIRLLPLLLLLLAIEVARRWRREERKPRWLALLFAALFLWSWPPVSWLLAGSLEWWYPTEPAVAAEAGAIVVLSGGAHPPSDHRPVPLLFEDTYTRCRRAAWIWHRRPALPLLATGGPFDSGEGSLAAVMGEFLQGEGVPPTKLWLEERSRTTYENALFSAEILREKGIRRVILVTEATHMLRSELAFRRQGIEVIPAPCGFRSAVRHVDFGDFLPSARAISTAEAVLHEWLGLAWYWARDRI